MRLWAAAISFSLASLTRGMGRTWEHWTDRSNTFWTFGSACAAAQERLGEPENHGRGVHERAALIAPFGPSHIKCRAHGYQSPRAARRHRYRTRRRGDPHQGRY